MYTQPFRNVRFAALAILAIVALLPSEANSLAESCLQPNQYGFIASNDAPGGYVARGADLQFQFCADTASTQPDYGVYITVDVPYGTTLVSVSPEPISSSGGTVQWWLYRTGADPGSPECFAMTVRVPPGYLPDSVLATPNIYDTSTGYTCNITSSAWVTGVITVPLLNLPEASAVYSGKARLPISLVTNGTPVSGTSNDICYDTDFITSPRADLGQAAMDACKTLEFNDFGHDGLCSAYNLAHLRVGVIGFEGSSGNPYPISDGEVAILTFDVSPSPSGSMTTLFNHPSATTPDGVPIEAGGADGALTAVYLPGDCDNTYRVTIAELQAAINMWSGLTAILGCVDFNGDNMVLINEVQLAINSYLYGGYAGSGLMQAPGPSGTGHKPAPSVSVGTASGKAGGTATLPIRLTTRSASLSAVSVDIAYDPKLFETPAAFIAPNALVAGKNVQTSNPSPGVFRVGVIGVNTDAISDGLVAKVKFAIKPDAPPGKATLQVSGTASDPSGNAMALGIANGKTFIKINKKGNAR